MRDLFNIYLNFKAIVPSQVHFFISSSKNGNNLEHHLIPVQVTVHEFRDQKEGWKCLCKVHLSVDMRSGREKAFKIARVRI